MKLTYFLKILLFILPTTIISSNDFLNTENITFANNPGMINYTEPNNFPNQNYCTVINTNFSITERPTTQIPISQPISPPHKIDGNRYISEIIMMIIVSRFISYLLYKIKIPRIIGDLIAGCILGPTIFQNFSSIVFLPVHRDSMKMLGYIGLIFSSISSGSNIDLRLIKGKTIKIAMFSLFNIFVSLSASYGLFKLIPRTEGFMNQNSNIFIENSYWLYFGAILSTTSLPMAFLILDELKIKNLDLHNFAIVSTTLTTIITFILVSIANSFENIDPIFDNVYKLISFRIGMLILIILTMILIQYLWNYGLKKYGLEKQNWFNRTSTDQTLLIICMNMGFAVATNYLGFSYVLGAFLGGCFLPYNDNIRKEFTKQTKFFSRWILLPLFFLDVGLQFDIRYLTMIDWEYVFLCLSWGYFFKALCMPFAYYVLKFDFYDSCFMTSIANCRGSNALVIGLLAYKGGLGQFGPTMFVISVLFSISTSVLAGFLCRYFNDKSEKQKKELEPKDDNESTAEITIC